jgi:hypothetical protein
MRGAIALLAILLVSCNQGTTPTASVSPSSASPSTSFVCRLPISLVLDLKRDLQGAFVDFPGGRVTIDPSGAGGASYSRRFNRWLPVAPNSIATDGERYAYLDPWGGFDEQGRLHVVDLATGKDLVDKIGVAGTGAQLPFLVLSFVPQGIWLTNGGYEGPGGGLFLLDLDTGALTETRLPGDARITEPVAGGPGTFWFTDPGPNPQVAAIGFPVPERVEQLTIPDGKSAIWFTKPGSYVRVLGTDLAGHPIVGAWESGSDTFDESVWVVSSPATAKEISTGHDAFQAIADSHGVWFGSSEGIYHYSDATGMKKITDQNANPAGTCS